MKGEHVDDELAAARAAVDAHPHWYHRIEVAPGVVTPGINDSQNVLRLLELPRNLAGKRVLDIGTRDGFFAFECEKQGADVTAVDYLPASATGFAIAARLLGSRVRYVQANLYRLDREQIGTFDVVLMLGLLYHLRDPLGAFDVVRDLCHGELLFETHVCDDALDALGPQFNEHPLMQFLPGESLNADPTNFWAPNTRCVDAMLQEAGFTLEMTTRAGNRTIVHARAAGDLTQMYHRKIARGEELPVN
jgi:tRNA (mo5U34)-methyltransferase